MEQIFGQSENYLLTRWIFLRLLGLVYLIAFLSLSGQIVGLIGQRGLLPQGELLKAVAQALGFPRAYFTFPTLSWLNSSDAFLKGMCWAGVGLSLLLLFGIWTTPVLFLLWLLYLSLTTAGQVFLSFQWDALLLEAGFLSIFLVPLSLLPRQALGPPPFLAVLLLRFLLFRLMFMSGIAKLVSNDPTWRDLTAISYHYETQPLPNPLAYWIFRLPLPFHKFSTLVALLTELAIPFLYFGPRLIRLVGFIFTVGLMFLIEGTGNFAFFNLLAIALAFLLLDDQFLTSIAPLSRLRDSLLAQASGATSWPNWVLIPLAAFYILFGSLLIFSRLSGKGEVLRPVQRILPVVSAYRLVNSYGLFAVMTTERPEIILEGSNDGQVWEAYEFKYKPGNLQRPPPIVAPHQPRLDWQMWFAALRGDYTSEDWFLRLVERLLANEPSVVSLLARNPFPDQPPRYIRAVLYAYEYTTPDDRRKSGNWWQREQLGYYLPPVSLPPNP